MNTGIQWPQMVEFTAYQYDAKFSAFEREVKIMPGLSPHGETIYVIPKWHTLVAPPTGLQPNYVPMFHERTQSWLVIADHRGEWWLDDGGKPVQVGRLGNPVLWGWRRLADQERAA